MEGCRGHRHHRHSVRNPDCRSCIQCLRCRAWQRAWRRRISFGGIANYAGIHDGLALLLGTEAASRIRRIGWLQLLPGALVSRQRSKQEIDSRKISSHRNDLAMQVTFIVSALQGRSAYCHDLALLAPLTQAPTPSFASEGRDRTAACSPIISQHKPLRHVLTWSWALAGTSGEFVGEVPSALRGNPLS